MAEPSSSILPPHPAMQPVKDETLRLVFSEEEGAYIEERIGRSKRGIWIASILGGSAPVVPVALMWNDGRLAEWLIGRVGDWGIFVVLPLVVFGLGAPLWAAIKVLYEVKTLRRYREYRQEHGEFLAKHNRCPINARGAGQR